MKLKNLLAFTTGILVLIGTFGKGTLASSAQWYWSNLMQIGSGVDSKGFSHYRTLIPNGFPNGFAKGKVVFLSISPGGTEYIVAKEGSIVSGVNTGAKAGFLTSISIDKRSQYLAINRDEFPTNLFNQQKIIRVRFNAPRYNEIAWRNNPLMKESVQLNNGKNIYLFNGQGLCSWLGEDFSSSFICVSSKISREVNIATLDSIITKTSYTSAINRVSELSLRRLKSIADKYYSQDQYPQAIAAYSEAIRLSPRYSSLYYNRGISYHLNGKNKEAIADLQKAAQLYQEQGKVSDYKDALQQLQSMQKIL
jgi:tetratricopeptide (TPR) repeat protein